MSALNDTMAVGSFEEFYRRHRSRIASLVRYKVHSVSEEDIEDVLQEAWIRAWEKLDPDANDKGAYHYVTLMAQRLGWRLAKKNHHRQELAPMLSLDAALDRPEGEDDEEHETVMRALANVSADPLDIVLVRERLREAVAA